MVKKRVTNNCIAIIPVRGGSKQIPRKNARLLNKKPLVAYTIEAALQSACFSEVIVSTDDEELAHIAQKYGAYVVHRPTELAEDHIGLDEVIVNAVNQYENKITIDVDFVATLQATSPFLKQETIQKALRKCIEEKRDTVLSVVNDTHLAWTVNNEKQLVPDYKDRVNRQMLPPRFKETGGIVVCTRRQLESGTRFGTNIGIVTCDKKEAIDIDDRFDWWIAEKSLKRKKIVFRVEGYKEIGLGHIYRCLTLADSMVDHDFVFVMSKQSIVGIDKVLSRFYQVIEFDKTDESELAVIESYGPDIVINDILDTETEYIRALKNMNCRVINFEDQGSGRLEADAVINAMYDNKSDAKLDHIYTGPEYICLREEFYSARPINFNENVEHILLLFGGTDPSNITEKILWWLHEINNNLKITVIVGSGYSHLKRLLQDIESTNNSNIMLVTDTNVITKYMERVDIAITSSGRTVFELAFLGIPMITINQNERESRHVFAQSECGVVNLGYGHELNIERFRRAVVDLLSSPLLRKKMHDSLLRYDFKEGIRRVWRIILEE